MEKRDAVSRCSLHSHQTGTRAGSVIVFRGVQLTRVLLAMLSASLLALLTFTPAVANRERLTPAAKAATRARLVGTAAVAPAAWNQIMGAGDISADPDTTTTADLATSEILIQAGPPLSSPPATTSTRRDRSETSPTRTVTPDPGDVLR